MLALLIVALVASALARPQFPTPVFHQPGQVGVPVRTVFSPVGIAPVNTGFRTLINDAGFSPVAPIRPTITTVQRIYQADDSGQFTSSHTDSVGTTFQETGSLAPTNDGLDRVLVKTGSFSYTSPEGTPVSVTYTADARGFHPISSAIPVAPQPIQPTF